MNEQINTECAERTLSRLNNRNWFTHSHTSEGENRTGNRKWKTGLIVLRLTYSNKNYFCERLAARERLAPVFLIGCSDLFVTLYVLLISMPDISHFVDCPAKPFVSYSLTTF